MTLYACHSKPNRVGYWAKDKEPTTYQPADIWVWVEDRMSREFGLLGVSMLNGKWRASIMAKGIRYYLGTYETPQIAYEVYLQAKRKLHPACTI